MTTIPIIDISALSGNDEVQKLKLVNKLGDTARNIGFFLVENHGISHEDIQKVYDQAKRFFALPIEEKMQFYIAKNPTHRGYVPFTEKGDYPDEISRNYEAFDLGMELEPALRMTQGSRLVGSNVWPDLLEFREIVYGYFQNVANVGMQICTALEHYLGLKQGSITAQMQQPISQLRLLHYINLETAGARSVNMGAHTDYECLTILHTANEGLQISPKTGEWIDVPVRPDAFVVNIGDMMEAFSNGVFRSTLHRVINEQPERYSLPYFLAPNYDTVIRPLPELLQGKNSEYEHYRFTAGEHLERMLKRDFPYLRDNETKCPSENLISPASSFTNPFEQNR